MDDTRLKKLRFRAWHRGFREADLILGPFADNHAQGLTETELNTFELLLEENDHDIFGWIVGRDDAPAQFAVLVARLRASAPGGEARGA